MWWRWFLRVPGRCQPEQKGNRFYQSRWKVHWKLCDIIRVTDRATVTGMARLASSDGDSEDRSNWTPGPRFES